MQTSKGLKLIKGLDHQTEPNLQVLVVFTLLLLCYLTGQNAGQGQTIISCQRKMAWGQVLPSSASSVPLTPPVSPEDPA